MIKNYILLAFIALGINFGTHAQHTPTVPNTIVVKLLPSTEACMSNGRVADEGFNKAFNGAEIRSFKQAFPGSTKPASNARSAATGKALIDLSSIYIVEYDGSKSTQEIIKSLKNTGTVIYAEPQYVDHILYVPNDPEAQRNTGKQWHLAQVKAYEAWDIEKGDTNVVLSIVDTDQNINHPDLKGKAKVNILDPINGKDDDGDSYIDNYIGWDVADNDNDVLPKQAIVRNAANTGNDTLYGHGHGTFVFGCAAAKSDNALGIAGSGFNSKVMPVKGMKDVDAKTGTMSNGYGGIYYAALKGAKVISCSWGSFGSYSQLAQDVINFATINHDALVIAAAGNENADKLFYPASYENVLAVAASDTAIGKKDIKADFATYNHYVDISSPGKNIYSTFKDAYKTDGGSSYSTPTVAGAAALVRAHFPAFTATQTAEQLRITADNMDTISANAAYKEKLGKGRLNIFRALTEVSSPVVRMYANDLPDNISTFTYAGETVKMIGGFVNVLRTTSNLKVTLRSLSPYVSMIDSTTTLGALGTLDSATNTADPFSFKLSSNIPSNALIEFRLSFVDGTYNDYQYFQATFNPDFIVLDTNQLAVTITSNGRIGFSDGLSTQGVGLVYKNKSLLFESGLIIGTSATTLSNCVRRDPQLELTDHHFEPTVAVQLNTPSFVGMQAYSELKDTNKTKVGVYIKQTSYAYDASPYDKFIIVRYMITNTSGSDIDTLRVGLFADWDIMNSVKNKADYNAANLLAYSYSTESGGLYGGVSLLSSEYPISVYSLDHNSAIGSPNINPNDGFSDLEKYTTISSGLKRTKAYGTNVNGSGGDVSQVIAAAIPKIKNNETRQLAFAFLAGDNLTDIKNSAVAAKSQYDILIKPTNTTIASWDASIITYPNPTKDVIQVQLPTSNTSYIISLTNVLGETLYSTNSNATNITIPMTEATQGMYFLKISCDGNSVIRKVIKE